MQNKLKILFILIICLPVMLFTGKTNNLICQNDIKLNMTSQYSIQYCNDKSNDTNVVVTIDAGKIFYSDSLYGFDFLIRYDTTKLNFSKPIYLNTLSETMPDKGVYFYGNTGEVRCYALNPKPIAGKLELIGFNGFYKNVDCWDSALVEFVDYELDDITRSIKVVDSLWIVPKNRMPENYSVTVVFNMDTLKYDKKMQGIIRTTLSNDNNLMYDSLIYNIAFSSKDKYRILNYKSISDSVTIETLFENNDILKIKAKFKKVRFKSIDFIEFNIEKLDTNNDNTTYLKIEPLKLSNCDCIKKDKMMSDSVLMFMNKDTVVNDIKEIIDNFIVQGIKNGFEIINNNEIDILKIQLFNYEGALLENYDIKNYQNKMYFDVKYPSGVYIVNIVTTKGLIKKSVLIYN